MQVVETEVEEEEEKEEERIDDTTCGFDCVWIVWRGEVWEWFLTTTATTTSTLRY